MSSPTDELMVDVEDSNSNTVDHTHDTTNTSSIGFISPNRRTHHEQEDAHMTAVSPPQQTGQPMESDSPTLSSEVRIQPRSYFSVVRERHMGAAGMATNNVQHQQQQTDTNMIPSSAAYEMQQDGNGNMLNGAVNSNSPTSSSPNKRHITAVLNPYTERIRAHAPSPPRSPVRGTFGMGGAIVPASAMMVQPQPQPTSPASSPLRRQQNGDSVSPQRSPVRLSSPAVAQSPTRGTTGGHGLPASPGTPMRRRASGTSAHPSPLHSSRSPQARSPVGAFYFPAGVPPSPATKLQHQSAVLQLSLSQPHGCFDAAGIAELTVAVLRLPRYCAPYVMAQCLAVQRGNTALAQAAREMKRQRNAANKGSAQATPSSQHHGRRVQHGQNDSSDMSVDALVIAGGTPSPHHPTNGGLLSPTAGPVDSNPARDRGVSSTSTSSSVQTSLTSPAGHVSLGSSSSGIQADTELSAITDASNEDGHHDESFLSPPSVARNRGGTNEDVLNNTHGSTDMLQVSDMIEAESAATGNEQEDGEEELIIPQTFLFYFSHTLEKFRDTTVRFFRVLAGSVEHLMDDTPVLTMPAMNGINSAIHSPITAPGSSSSITPHRQTPTTQKAGMPPLHIPSPRMAGHSSTGGITQGPLSPLATAPKKPCPPTPTHLCRHHFSRMLDCILETHPGLTFLAQTPEFQVKYAQTCVARIFYTLQGSGGTKTSPASGARDRLTLNEVRRSNLLQELFKLEEEEDINLSVKYFSYQHFYVCYCSFWELDQPDHDGWLSEENLLAYDSYALNPRIVKRIIQDCDARRKKRLRREQREYQQQQQQQALLMGGGQSSDGLNTTGNSSIMDSSSSTIHEQSESDAPLDPSTPVMTYEDFIPFFLSEIDKSSPQAIQYWMHLLDIDHDGVLSLYEIDYWFREQLDKIQALSSDTIRTKDIICQVLDMIKGGDKTGVSAGAENMVNTTLLPPPALQERGHSLGAPGQGEIGMTLHSFAPLASPPSVTRSTSDPVSVLPHSASADAGVGAGISFDLPHAFEHSSHHITLKDLQRSGLASYFFNLLFNLPKFLACESRDPVKSREKHENSERGITEWEAYANHMYQALVQNEELQARAMEQQNARMVDEGEEDAHLSQHEQHYHQQHHDADQMEDAPVHQQHSHQQAIHPDEELRCEEDTELIETYFGGGRRKLSPGRQHARHHPTQQHQPEDADMTDESPEPPRAHVRPPELNQDSREFLAQRFARTGNQPHVQHHPHTHHHPVSLAHGQQGTCFFVSDEDSSSSNSSASPEVVAATRGHEGPLQPLVPQSHIPQHSSSFGTLMSIERRRQEEQDFLAMQRKIHHAGATDEDDDDVMNGAAQLLRATSPTASSRPITIPSPNGGAHSPLQRLAIGGTSEDEDQYPTGASDEPGGSVSPPYVLASAPRTSSSAMLLSRPHGASTQTTSPEQLHPLPGKENAFPLSPTSHAATGGTSTGFKRQLQFAAPTKPAPLSPSATVIAHTHH